MSSLATCTARESTAATAILKIGRHPLQLSTLKLSFLIVLFSGVAYAGNLPKEAQIEVLADFSGGLNTSSPKHKVDKNQSPDMRNVFIHRMPGTIIKRSGFILAGTTTTLKSGRFMFTFNKEDGSKEFIVSDDSIVLTTQDYQTYTFISSGLNNSVHLNATQARNKVWFTNGVDAVFTWDGTTKQILDGTKSTPAVPRFKYITYWQERVFGGNVTGNGALTQWSDVASTAGAAIAPDNFLAWPQTNALSVGQGDGTSITALWVYKGQIQVGKEHSIYTRYGTNTSSYFDRKTEGQAGVSSNDSVVLLDGFTYYKGYDGIYAYDGSSSKRLSDDIVPDIDAMLDSTVLVKSNVWDTNADFIRGTQFGTTVTLSGLVTMSTVAFPAIGTIVGTPPGTDTLTETNTFYGPIQVNFGTNISSDQIVYTKQISIPFEDLNGSPRIGVQIHNPFTGVTVFAASTATTQSPCVIILSSQSPLFDGGQISASSYTVKFEYLEGAAPNQIRIVFPITVTFLPSTTGQFISDVGTVSAVSRWGNFNSINNTNGGTIRFSIRSSTSLVNITTQTWKIITPGVVVSEPIQNLFVQWATSMTSLFGTNASEIDNVTIDHIEGAGSSDRPFGIDWKNEYWLSVATETTGMFSLQYVKSWITNPLPNAWNPLQGINIRGWCKNGENSLYAGAASTGAFYRLDYGTNDNGQPIQAYYTTPQLVLRGGMKGENEGNWMQEQLSELWVDAMAETGNTFRLGTSYDGGAYVDQTFSLTGTDRVLKVLYTPNKFGKYFSWRFRNTDLDKGLGLNAFAVIYTPLQTRD